MNIFQKLTILATGTALSCIVVLKDNPSIAAILTVTNLNDSGSGSLRAAVDQANSNTTVGDDTIEFAPGLTGTIPLTSGALDINLTDPLNHFLDIVGPSVSSLLTVDGSKNGLNDIFDISPASNISIFNLTISGAKLDGIHNFDGDLFVDSSTVSSNGRDGVFNTGVATVFRSTVSGNEDAGVVNTFQAEVANSTVNGNEGDGVSNVDFGNVQISYSTITNNQKDGIFNDGGHAVVGDSIIAKNAQDVSGDFTNASNYLTGYNLIGNGDGSTGFMNGIQHDQVGTGINPIDSLLGPLADNGGPTETEALLPSSPAIDAANPGFFEATDQRGIIRPQGRFRIPDIGAYELEQPTPPPPPPLPVPEPSTMLGSLTFGAIGTTYRRRRNKSN